MHFVDCLTLVRKVFDMTNSRICNGSYVIKNKQPQLMSKLRLFYGGAEGGRTPVRKEIYGSIYGCSLSTGFPSRQAGKQADGTVADECVTSRTALGRSRAPHKMMPRAGPVVVPGRTAA